MNPAERQIIGTRSSQFLLPGVALLTVAGGLMLGGCKGNANAAATLERITGKPPTIAAQHLAGDAQVKESLLTNGPATSAVWKGARWTKLTAPANVARKTASTQVAFLYDDEHLYVGFVSDQQPGDGQDRRDSVSLYLDTTSSGKELFHIALTSKGEVSTTWHRATVPPMPQEDGSPDFTRTMDAFPGFAVAGLKSAVQDGVVDGRAVWTAVIVVPIKGLPTPLWSTPGEGQRWKVNALRSVATMRGGRRAEILQSNLSPVFVDAQAVSPYRLAELEFEGADSQ